jgi:hypothetical protein
MQRRELGQQHSRRRGVICMFDSRQGQYDRCKATTIHSQFRRTRSPWVRLELCKLASSHTGLLRMLLPIV